MTLVGIEVGRRLVGGSFDRSGLDGEDSRARGRCESVGRVDVQDYGEESDVEEIVDVEEIFQGVDAGQALSAGLDSLHGRKVYDDDEGFAWRSR